MKISDKHLSLLLLSGVFGSFLMFLGDQLLYFELVSGANYNSVETMSKMPLGRIIAGGVVAPFAAFFSMIGGYSFYLIFRKADKFWAKWLFIFFALMMAVAGTYHAVFANYGIIGRLNEPQRTEQLANFQTYLHFIFDIIFILGSIWTFILFFVVIFKKTIFPYWLLIFTPTILILLSSYIRIYIPYPLGTIIYGGWINLCFGLFFLLSFLYFRKKKI